MKGKLFLYLFLFALLYIVFQYTNAQKTFERQHQHINDLKEKLKISEKNIDSLQAELAIVSKFNLKNNDKAKEFFEDLGFSIPQLTNAIETKLMSTNLPNSDNPLIPYSGMEGNIHINSIRILNHKWLIAEFTDSVYWGEAIIEYFVHQNGEINFDTEDAFLYPK